MTVNTIEERKRYINEIKASFQNPEHSERYRDFSDTSSEERPGIFSFKFRMLLAILLFTAFIYCDQTKMQVGEYKTQDVYEIIQENISLEKVLQIVYNVHEKQ